MKVKKLLIYFLFFIISCLFTSFTSFTASDYDISAIYKSVDVDDGVRVLVNDEVSAFNKLLVPIQLDNGKYVVNVTRIANNLYKIDNKNIYIQTKYCYEYCYSQEVALIVKSSYGFIDAKIIF